jgi:hypothetical protein
MPTLDANPPANLTMAAPSPALARAHSAQSAIVRTLADTIEHFAARGDTAEGLREQLVQELERLHLQRVAGSAG